MPKFTPEFLDELKARVRASEVIGRRVKLQKRGDSWWGLSPFKTEKTPSFTVNDDRRSYHCFSTDNHGDVIRFLQETEGLSFVEAVSRLAEEIGMELPSEDPRAVEKSRIRRGLADACAAAADFFAASLRRREGRDALDYLQRRGVTDAEIDAFGIGYAGTGRAALRDHLLERGFDERTLVEAGLTIRPDDGGATFDRFRGRVMFPIRRGKDVIAFGGRALDPNARAKYLNSPETPIFRKGEVLYNFDAARSAVASAKVRSQGAESRLVVCEGYMDVIALWGAGFKGAVAPLGTALTEEQIALLWRVDEEPLLCLDGDEAGLKAADRALDRALPMLAAGRSLGFIFLPDGQDPDDVVRAGGPDAFRRLCEDASPLVEVLWRREVDAARLDTPERRTAFRKRLRDLVRSIADHDVRVAYGEEFAARLAGISAMGAASGRAAPGAGAGAVAGTWPRSDAARLASATGGDSRRQTGPRRRFRSEHDARLHGSRPSQEAMRVRAQGGSRACEATLLACLIIQPAIAYADEDALLALEFEDRRLDRLLAEIMGAIAATPDLDSDALRRHVESSPAADVLRDLMNDQWLMRQTFLRPDAGPSEVEAGWRATWRRYSLVTQIERELVESASSVFSDGDESWRAAAAARMRFAQARTGADDVADGDDPSAEELLAKLDSMGARFR